MANYKWRYDPPETKPELLELEDYLDLIKELSKHESLAQASPTLKAELETTRKMMAWRWTSEVWPRNKEKRGERWGQVLGEYIWAGLKKREVCHTIFTDDWVRLQSKYVERLRCVEGTPGWKSHSHMYSLLNSILDTVRKCAVDDSTAQIYDEERLQLMRRQIPRINSFRGRLEMSRTIFPEHPHSTPVFKEVYYALKDEWLNFCEQPSVAPDHVKKYAEMAAFSLLLNNKNYKKVIFAITMMYRYVEEHIFWSKTLENNEEDLGKPMGPGKFGLLHSPQASHVINPIHKLLFFSTLKNELDRLSQKKPGDGEMLDGEIGEGIYLDPEAISEEANDKARAAREPMSSEQMMTFIGNMADNEPMGSGRQKAMSF